MKKTLYRLTAAFFAIVVSLPQYWHWQAAVHQKQLIQVTAVKRIKKRLKLLQEIIIWIYQSWE